MNEIDSKMKEEIAAGEQWLAGFSAPSPSPAALERTRQAVQGELLRMQSGRLAAPRWAAWHGAFAAAAAIALAVTIGWYSFETAQPSGNTGTARTDSLLAWSADAQEEVTRFASLDEGLSDLEEWSAEQPWAANGASLYEAIEGTLEDDVGPSDGESGALAPPSQDHHLGSPVA
jgi:hypothetical protein